MSRSPATPTMTATAWWRRASDCCRLTTTWPSAFITCSAIVRSGMLAASIGKTVVSSSMIDRVAGKLGRKVYEVPVGFKWFVDGLVDGSLGFVGEESAGASFLRRDGSVWTTDKDGIIAALLAAEMTAKMGKDPGEIYSDLTRDLGDPVYERIDAAATHEQKAALAKLSAKNISVKRTRRGTDPADSNVGARGWGGHRRRESGQRRRMVRGAAVGDGRGLQDLRGELPWGGAFEEDSAGSSGDCRARRWGKLTLETGSRYRGWFGCRPGGEGRARSLPAAWRRSGRCFLGSRLRIGPIRRPECRRASMRSRNAMQDGPADETLWPLARPRRLCWKSLWAVRSSSNSPK